MHNNIMAAGSRDSPPMLATGGYAQWRSRFLRYIDTKTNGDALRKCILEGPYIPSTVVIQVVPATKNSLADPEHTTSCSDIHELSPANKINLLVDKKYPLKKEILKKMINLKIEAEEESNMASELIKSKKTWKLEQNNSIAKLCHLSSKKILKKNDLKARSILMMTLPSEHLLTFNKHKDAKSLFEAIEARFGGNEATKKTQKTLLKQMYETFSASSSESLDSIFNRLQKIVSQLTILGENITPEELNLKFLRSLPTEWGMHVVVWRNKSDLGSISFDDLYNNFKIVEPEVKRSITSSSNSVSQNLAFVSGHSSTNDDNIANVHVSTSSFSGSYLNVLLRLVMPYLEQIHEDDLDEMNLKWQLALLSMKARKFYQRTGKKIVINGRDTAGYDKKKVECFNCHKLGHFARECRNPKSQENRSRSQDNSRRIVNVEEASPKAMLAIDGIGFDWSYMAQEEASTNFALMAFSDSEVQNNKTCSKTCLKNYKDLKTQYDKLRVELRKSESDLSNYKRGLASVEERLVFYKKNESMLNDQIVVLKRDASYTRPQILLVIEKQALFAPPVLNSPYFMVKSWLVQDQTVLGQTATGKESSNPFMAGSLPKTISSMIHISQEVILLKEERTVSKDSEVCKITKANGTSSFHGDFQALLRRLDRQDLFQLYSLVQERYKHRSIKGHDLDLWGDLKMMFDPNEEDDIWLNQHHWELLRWKLHEYSGVHSLFLDGTSIQINMLVDKKYPLKKEILKKMINLKIEAEEESNMASELIKFIKSQIAEQEAIERLQQVNPKQSQKDKEMQKNLALIAKYKNDNQSGQFGNQRTMTVAGARETVGGQVVQQSGIQCFNSEKGVQLQAEQFDWLVDTDEEIDEQELEAHYSYMAKIQEVHNADSGTNFEPLKQVKYDSRYNVFANEIQHSKQSESISNTCVVETVDGNVISDSPNMCDNDIQNDQNAVECDDERVALANLIANLKLDIDQNKKIQKQLKKANASLTQELKK
ncbi:ribonuclease H-like domain-containing protein [Tanacetum coccineum]